MELANIENLLEAYFEGNTTLEQETTLQEYFSSDNVAPHLTAYQDLFNGFSQAREEGSQRALTFPDSGRTKRFWNYGIAASFVAALGIAGMTFFGGPSDGLTSEEREALAAFNESKKTLLLLSENLNKGTSELAHISEFTNSKNKVLK